MALSASASFSLSLTGLINHISLARLIGDIGFIGIGLSSLISFISLFGHIGLVGRIGHNSLASVISLSLVSLVSLISLSIYWPFKLASHGVAIKLTSATKITNAAIRNYCAASHWFVRESWLCYVRLPTGRLNSSFFREALHNAKQ
jgi:hypothetical protein